MADDYEELSTAELQAELRSRGLPDDGLTEELIDRLRDDDADDDGAGGDAERSDGNDLDSPDDTSDLPPRSDDGRFVSSEDDGEDDVDGTDAADEADTDINREGEEPAAQSTTDDGTADDGEEGGYAPGRTGDASPNRTVRQHDEERTGGARMPVNTTHARYMKMLLDHAAQRRYPSHHMLHRVEEMITDRAAAEAYVDLLLTEAESRRYPSHHMLERAQRVIVRMAVADELARLEREAAERRERRATSTD